MNAQELKLLVDKQGPTIVQLNSNFKLDDSLDVGYIIEVKKVKVDGEYSYGTAMEIVFNLLPEHYKHNIRMDAHMYYDANRKPTLNYYEAMHQNTDWTKDIISDSLFCMENDDWFDVYKPFEKELKAINDFINMFNIEPIPLNWAKRMSEHWTKNGQ